MVSSSMKTMSYLFTQSSGRENVVSKNDSSDSFDKVMSNNYNKTAQNVQSKSETPADKNGVKKDIKADNRFERTSAKEIKDIVKEVTEEITDDTVDVENIEEIPEEISEEILNCVALILNIPVEELKNALADMEMDCKDLLRNDNVTELVMNLNNIQDKFELLVHQDAGETIKNIEKSIKEMLETFKEVNVENAAVVETYDSIQPEISENVVENPLAETENDKSEEVSKNDKDFKTESITKLPETSVAAEKETETESGLSQEKNNNDESSINNDMLDNLANVKENLLNEIENVLNERVDGEISTRIVREISENIRVAVRQNVTTLEMQLYPEHLGKITINLVSKDGAVSAKITAENDMAKSAIEQQLTLLKENLNNQGVKIADVEVTIASHGFEQNLDRGNDGSNEADKKSTRVRKSLLDEINGENPEENKESEVLMETLGNTVSYLA